MYIPTPRRRSKIRNREVHREPLPADGKWLLMINSLFAGAGGLSGTFLNIYLWKILKDLEQIAVFNLFIFLFAAIGFATAGWLAKRTDRLYTLRIGVAVLALFYVLILLLGPRVGQWYAGLGCLQGFGAGFYWLSYNILVFEVTEPKTRDTFNGANGFLVAIATGVAPMLAGWILSTWLQFGYRILFLLSFGLFLTAVLVTWWLSRRKEPPLFDLNAGFRPEEHGGLWRQTLGVCLLIGFREGTLFFLPFLLLFVVTRDELLASRYLLITAVLSLAANYVAKRFLTFERRPLFVTVSAFMLGLSVLLLLIQVNTTGLFVFGILNSLFAPLLLIPFSCLTYDVMGRLPQAEHRKAEYLVIREVAVDAGRCLSLLLLVVNEAFLQEATAIRIAFLTAGMSSIAGLFLYKRSHEAFVNTCTDPARRIP
jgi:MFS transporter, YQGE family, putative transporter